MNISYWEHAHMLKSDVIIVGGGITGLSAALSLIDIHPALSITILEKGVLPSGATSKNAGFACFGSIAELEALRKESSMPEVMSLVKRRIDGLSLLRQRVPDEAMNFRLTGGGEWVLDQWTDPRPLIDIYNSALEETTGLRPYQEADQMVDKYGWNKSKVKGFIANQAEGMIDSGMLMKHLQFLCHQKQIRILTGAEVINWDEDAHQVEIHTRQEKFSCKLVLFCTNGFLKQQIPDAEVVPGRGQVLVTAPIPHLLFDGVFHFHEGYGYFRNINGRVLLGGGRNFFRSRETTYEHGITTEVQAFLEDILYTYILPGQRPEIAFRWSGIMGFGGGKDPICQSYSARVFAAGRMQGMGVALGSGIAHEAAQLISQSGIL